MDKDGNTLIKAKPRPGVSGINRVLVTGGAGFVGSHLIDFLMARGDHVMCLDNFFTGSKENIQHHIGKPNFEIVRHDVVEPILLECDQVYHLACPASPVHYKFNPVKTIKTNVIGTLNMLGLAKRVKARFLLTSTSEVYGDPLQHPQTEEYWGNVNPIGERSCYDEGKRCAETLAFDYKREHGLEIRVARIFNTYGPRMALDDGRVVSNFVKQVPSINSMEASYHTQSISSKAMLNIIKARKAPVDDKLSFSNKPNELEVIISRLPKIKKNLMDTRASFRF